MMMKMNEEQRLRHQSVMQELQNDITTWSSHSRLEIVDGASHYIQFDRPDIVINAIREVVSNIRKS
jgi:pimeloyl-ACP methyl ester carboxylesterase